MIHFQWFKQPLEDQYIESSLEGTEFSSKSLLEPGIERGISGLRAIVTAFMPQRLLLLIKKLLMLILTSDQHSLLVSKAD